MKTKIWGCFLLVFGSVSLFADVRSLLVEQTDFDELTVSFSSNYNSCTVHWRKNGTGYWNSYNCEYGDGSLSINGLAPGSYEIRVTPNASDYYETRYGKSCVYAVSRWTSRETYRAIPNRTAPPKRSPSRQPR